jgi:hypothetical protein
MKYIFISTIVLIASLHCFAQKQTANNFSVFNRSLSFKTDGPAQVIYLNERDDEGIAWIKGKHFTNGTIEVDIKGRDVLQRSFLVIAFHGINDTTYEAIYFRPFNFRADDAERKVHNVQYIAMPGFDWPKLRAEHHNQYEKGIDSRPDPNAWFHAKIEVHGTSVKVFVNDNATPSLSISALTHTGGKMIGYWVGNGSDGSWKNMRLTPTDN